MDVNFSELHQDLRLFHKQMRGEVLRIIHNESKALGPLKYKLTALIRVKKLTDIGEEGFDFFIRQENPTLLNAFSVQTLTE